MARILVTLGLVALLSLPVAASPPQLDQNSAVMKEVVTRPQELARAVIAKDEAAIKRLVADECMFMTARGLITRDAWIENTTKRMSLTTQETKEARGAVYGDTAVVFSRSAFTAKLAAPDPKTGSADLTGENVLTDVWVKRDGRWQLVARQSGPASK